MQVHAQNYQLVKTPWEQKPLIFHFFVYFIIAFVGFILAQLALVLNVTYYLSEVASFGKSTYSGSVSEIGKYRKFPVITHRQNPGGNFVLYISNSSKSPKFPSVEMTVYIDEILALSDTFTTLPSYLDPKSFQFSIDGGVHTIQAEVKGHTAILKDEFEVTDRHWAVVEFIAVPKTDFSPEKQNLLFHIQDSPIIFRYIYD